MGTKTIVLARVDIETVPDGRPYARDLGHLPTLKEIRVSRALVWLNEGTDSDVENARKYAASEGYTVLIYPTVERDPLGRAKREMV